MNQDQVLNDWRDSLVQLNNEDKIDICRVLEEIGFDYEEETDNSEEDK